MILNQPLTLPCGAILPNRIAKAAMTEGLADIYGRPTPELDRLYGIWSDGRAGLQISGNIVIDADHLERPGNVIIDSAPDEEMTVALKRWTAAATRHGNHFWAQISHAGRQTMKAVNPRPKAPSAVKLGLPGGQFGMPVDDGQNLGIVQAQIKSGEDIAANRYPGNFMVALQFGELRVGADGQRQLVLWHLLPAGVVQQDGRQYHGLIRIRGKRQQRLGQRMGNQRVFVV